MSCSRPSTPWRSSNGAIAIIACQRSQSRLRVDVSLDSSVQMVAASGAGRALRPRGHHARLSDPPANRRGFQGHGWRVPHRPRRSTAPRSTDCEAPEMAGAELSILVGNRHSAIAYAIGHQARPLIGIAPPFQIPGQDQRLLVRVGFWVCKAFCVIEEHDSPHIRPGRAMPQRSFWPTSDIRDETFWSSNGPTASSPS